MRGFEQVSAGRRTLFAFLKIHPLPVTVTVTVTVI